MSFSKCSNLEATLRTIISDKQNLRNKAFLYGFYASENKKKFKLKVKLTETKI